MFCRLNSKMIFFISVMVCKLKKKSCTVYDCLTSLGLKYRSQVTGHMSFHSSQNSSNFRIYSRFSFFLVGLGGGGGIG